MEEGVNGGWGCKGCAKLKNILSIKQAEFSEKLKGELPPENREVL